MQNPHPKYKVREGDTIPIITERFGVKEIVWINYHNNECRMFHEIGKKIPNRVKEIYLLPELWEKADELNYITPLNLRNYQQPIVLHMGGNLYYAPANLDNRYGVIFHLQKDKVHYEIDCIYKGNVSDSVYQIAFDRHQVYINNQEPDLRLYEMADQMAKAVYPLFLDINRERKIEKIYNHPEIVQRCNNAQKKLSQYYVGEYAEKYFRLFEKQYSNPDNLINHIENELFYQLFFLPIQGSYENLQKKIQYEFVSGKNNTTTYNLVVTLESEYTESGKLIAHIISEEKQDAQPCFEAEYRLHPEDHSIFSIRGYLIKMNDKQVPCRTDFEIYHLNPEKRIIKKIIPRYESIYLAERKTFAPQKKEFSFWDIFS